MELVVFRGVAKAAPRFLIFSERLTRYIASVSVQRLIRYAWNQRSENCSSMDIAPTISALSITEDFFVIRQSSSNTDLTAAQERFSGVAALLDDLRASELPPPTAQRPLQVASRNAPWMPDTPQPENFKRRWMNSGLSTKDLLKYQKNLLADIRRLSLELETPAASCTQTLNKILWRLTFLRTRLNIVTSALDQLKIDKDASETPAHAQRPPQTHAGQVLKNTKALQRHEDTKRIEQLDRTHADLNCLSQAVRSTSIKLADLDRSSRMTRSTSEKFVDGNRLSGMTRSTSEKLPDAFLPRIRPKTIDRSTRG